MTKKEIAEMETLRRQRDEAIRAMERYTQESTPTDFWSDEILCTTNPPSFSRRYLDVRHVTLGFDGLEVEMRRTPHDEVHITFAIASGDCMVAMVPQASNCINIVKVTRDHRKRKGEAE
jgi:hypothetical protein